MTTDERSYHGSHARDEDVAGDPYAAGGDTATEGTVFTANGQDWDDIVRSISEAPEERVVVNMGPQHP